jgi:methyl-accepting chemotaxis protein
MKNNDDNAVSRLLPRSLWLQMVVLVTVALGITWVVATPLFHRFAAAFDQELDKRGRGLTAALEKHTDLRLAVSLGDAAQATPILRAIAESDEDVRYIALFDAKKQPFAFASPSLSSTALTEAVGAHFSQNAQAGLLRFSQPVTRAKEAAGGGLDFAVADPNLGKADDKSSGEVLGYVALALSSDRAQRRITQQAFVTVGTTALVLYALVLLYFRWVARRLSTMAAFAKRVARGELDEQLDAPLGDEVGQLSSALASVSDNMRTVVGELKQASSSLSSGAHEVFESAGKQAENASRQAASVTEMAATVSELRSIFNQATSKAESVIDLAKKSEESSSGGAAAVLESVDGMRQLRDHVAAIAQTIQGLVQKTDQIDAIIDVVNDLAEQSNVLAINAGIEAARAGEHGRGFAVVAREVSRLAERSKESTSQVRLILQDIERAGRDAVRVIDEGSRRAESGMTVAKAAGTAIERLKDAIGASSQAAMQIAASTRQQSQGIEQIWQATREIDHVANETAAGTHALEAAAANMKALSEGLARIVGRYRS